MKNETNMGRIFIAIPLLNESYNLNSLINSIRHQSFNNFSLYMIVNQPDDWWEIEGKKQICEDNQKSLEYLKEVHDLDIHSIDRSSRGKGWLGKRHGVGWARKVVLDEVDNDAGPDDIVISLDADTEFGPDYLASIHENFSRHPKALAISVPYYHRLTGDEAADRSILRYEIYMRAYAINLWRIKSPYSYTALGSAIAFRSSAYRKIGGMTPMMSGEDFYFLQKMVKAGKLLNWNREKVYPATRFSDRVYFGTGPAMIRGRAGDWSSYPVYNISLFDNIHKTTQLFEDLFYKNISTPLDDFMKENFREDDPWDPMRRNNKNADKFIKACHERLDGLRILQYLKKEQKKLNKRDEGCLCELLMYFEDELKDRINFTCNELDFDVAEINLLDRIRNILMEIEEGYQKQDFNES